MEQGGKSLLRFRLASVEEYIGVHILSLSHHRIVRNSYLMDLYDLKPPPRQHLHSTCTPPASRPDPDSAHASHLHLLLHKNL